MLLLKMLSNHLAFVFHSLAQTLALARMFLIESPVGPPL